MSKKSRTLLLSMVTACLCLVLIVAATYALFPIRLPLTTI